MVLSSYKNLKVSLVVLLLLKITWSLWAGSMTLVIFFFYSFQTTNYAFVNSCLDWSNALFANLPLSTLNPLQPVQNFVARLTYCCYKFTNLSPILQNLHLLIKLISKSFLLTIKFIIPLLPLTYLFTWPWGTYFAHLFSLILFFPFFFSHGR